MPSQEQTIEATIQGIQPDGNGWVKVVTDQGEFTTKFPEPIAEAQAHIGQRVLVAYEQGQARAKNDGSGYWPAPRYFKRVSAPGYVQPQAPQPFAGQQPQQSQPPQQPQQQAAPQHEERELRIMRQAAGKLAVWTMPLVPSEQRTFQNQLAVAEAWMRYFVGGVQGTGLSLSPQAQARGDAALSQEQQMAMGGYQQDDGIPF